jgi:hypothetical protein
MNVTKDFYVGILFLMIVEMVSITLKFRE